MDRPILFSAAMVRAILDGRKTQTRRPIKPQPETWACQVPGMQDIGGLMWRGMQYETDASDDIEAHCPYGKPGDLLWVKETFAEVHPVAITEGRFTKRLNAGIPGPPPVEYLTIYRADGEFPGVYHTQEYPWRSLTTDDGIEKEHYPNGHETRWIPSMFMPRRASRLTLRITDVRLEQLQKISEADAIAEGVERHIGAGGVQGWKPYVKGNLDVLAFPQNSYRTLWNSIHGTNGPKSWDANPWVWVVGFEVIQ